MAQTTPRAVETAPAYGDGSPLDRIQFFDAKLILKPDFFESVRGFRMFSDIVAEAVARVPKLTFAPLNLSRVRPRIREILFVDTPDFRLYNNSFILRRRVEYQDGFPISDPEIVCKFRNADRPVAQNVDMRPKIAGPYRMKFKAEALPLKDQIGGFRLLFSHNCIFPASSAHVGDRTNLQNIARALPALKDCIGSDTGNVELVSDTLVEEVLMDLGTIDFGKGLISKTNISLWRSLVDHHVMCGEFAYQTKFTSVAAIDDLVKARMEELFIKLQQAAVGWLLFGSTKTGLVYRAKGNAPQGHE